jgi:hypothetical protein
LIESGQGFGGTDVLLDPPPRAHHRYQAGQAGGGGGVAAVKGQLAGVAVAADEQDAVPEVMTGRGVVWCTWIMAQS